MTAVSLVPLDGRLINPAHIVSVRPVGEATCSCELSGQRCVFGDNSARVEILLVDGDVIKVRDMTAAEVLEALGAEVTR